MIIGITSSSTNTGHEFHVASISGYDDERRHVRAYFQCGLEDDKVPSARAIQTLVQAWKEMREWPKRTSAK
jgi:hypothetical protein